MKKLRLNLEQLNNAQVLTRSQLRNVLGGGGMDTTMPGGGGETTVESHSCCISAYLADGYNPYPMQFTPQTVSSQAACQSLADNIASSGTYTNVHYDTDCDGH